MRFDTTVTRWARACALASMLSVAATPARAQGPSVLTLLPTEDRVLEIGGEFTGALSASDHLSPDDQFLEAWELRGQAGRSVTLDLLSDVFDPRLYVVGPGLTETLTDDDSGGGCNARISFTMLESGTFRVVATSLGRRTSGVYTVRVSDRPGPTPTYGCGEVDPDLLASLPTDGRTLRMGATASGRLGPESRAILDGRLAEAWLLEGRAGDRVSIVMESAAFDSYLYVLGPGLDGLLSDDDGAGNLDAKVDLTLPSDGPFTVVASALGTGASGPYMLRIEEPMDLATIPTSGLAIAVGETRSAALSDFDPIVVDGRRGQVWALEGVEGQVVTIELRSAAFDAYLYLAGPGLAEPLTDDDGAGDLDSRISVTLPASGTYRVIVSALGGNETGAFTLSVSGR